MGRFDVARSCARRWHFFIPLILIVGWLGDDVYSSVKPVYHANAVIGLTPPSTKIYNPQGVPLRRNGLLDIGGADLIANMAAVGLREPSAADRVVEGGGIPDYVSKMFPAPSGTSPLPIVMVDATAADPAAATRTPELVNRTGRVTTLRELQQQAQVREDQMVARFVVSPPSTLAAGMPVRTRSTVAIFAAGAGLTVLATVSADTLPSRLSAAMRRRRSAAAEVAAQPAETPTDVPQPINASPAEGAPEPR